jgi:hypothetical protein
MKIISGMIQFILLNISLIIPSEIDKDIWELNDIRILLMDKTNKYLFNVKGKTDNSLIGKLNKIKTDGSKTLQNQTIVISVYDTLDLREYVPYEIHIPNYIFKYAKNLKSEKSKKPYFINDESSIDSLSVISMDSSMFQHIIIKDKYENDRKAATYSIFTFLLGTIIVSIIYALSNPVEFI